MPLVIRWPGVVEPGSINDDIVSNLDFAETFLDIAGAGIPREMQGRSFLPILKGRTPADWRKTFYYHYYEFPGAHSVARHYGVTDGHYKLINFYENKDWEMFDLTADPNELQSIYGRKEYVGIQSRLEKELVRLRQYYRVPNKDPDSTRPKPRPKRTNKKK